MFCLAYYLQDACHYKSESCETEHQVGLHPLCKVTLIQPVGHMDPF